jgi:hypothetical protein
MTKPNPSPLDADEIIRIWEGGHWRTSASTFHRFCLANYGGRGSKRAAAARRIVTQILLAQQKSIGEIAQELGCPWSTAQRDVQILNPKYAKRPKLITEAQRQNNRQLDRIRGHHAALLQEAMCNAPADAVNIPMLSRATKVVQMLRELSALGPKIAASQMPAPRCREYSGAEELVTWLSDFVKACNHRRQTETPTLGHLRTSRRQ